MRKANKLISKWKVLKYNMSNKLAQHSTLLARMMFCACENKGGNFEIS